MNEQTKIKSDGTAPEGCYATVDSYQRVLMGAALDEALRQQIATFAEKGVEYGDQVLGLRYHDTVPDQLMLAEAAACAVCLRQVFYVEQTAILDRRYKPLSHALRRLEAAQEMQGDGRDPDVHKARREVLRALAGLREAGVI